MSGRKLNPHEQKLHQAALADPKKMLTQKEIEALVPDRDARTNALNFLLGTGVMKAMKDTRGVLTFRAVEREELKVQKNMSGEEAMILSYIQAAKDEGIWTKHLKAKTELHQTVIDRCLKSLVQKQLIKAVKSVKYPTRKIYMLYHLDPSVEMTGGPWYTDNELDTEFIKLLCSACLRFIRDRSTPKQKNADSSSSANNQLLYPISAAPQYPTAQQILTFLSKSRITETQLTVEHVEMLLNVLVLDGEIERVPGFGAAMWDTSTNAGRASDYSDSDDGYEKKKKRKRKDRDEDTPKRDRKRSKRSRSDSESESDSDSENERERERRRKRKKSKSRSRAASGDEESEDLRERRKRKKKRKDDDEGDGNGNEDEDLEMGDVERKGRSKSKSKHKNKNKSRRKRYQLSSSSSSSSGSDSESDSDRSRSRSRSKSKSSIRSKRKCSSSPVDVTESFLQEDYGAYVYRAIRQERLAAGGGGLAQTPCVRCPTFDFCKDGGPVNPKECTYYTGWLAAADVANG
ncbi:RNA polymerase Rpc34 subunit-domain-containing protein [Fomes fomentarius]|nr:RNA polymerase Rpc34 subunit-domain-containing protein [Fomes fomentarius]